MFATIRKNIIGAGIHMISIAFNNELHKQNSAIISQSLAAKNCINKEEGFTRKKK